MKNNIKHIRCQKNLTLGRVSKSAGICLEELKAIEQREWHNITVEEWFTIAEAMDTTIADLLDLPIITIDNESNNERSG